MKEVIVPQSSPIIQFGTTPTQSHVNLIKGIHSLRASSPGGATWVGEERGEGELSRRLGFHRGQTREIC